MATVCGLGCGSASTDASLLDRPAALDGGTGVQAVHVKFDLGPGSAMHFGAIPWPDDLYLQQGRVVLSEFPEPQADPDFSRSLRDALTSLDGFGASSPVYFFLDGDLDPSSLPQTAEESTGPRASVFLIDADPGSPEAFHRVRAEVQWYPDTQRLALRPALGHPLIPGRRYAAFVTSRVRDTRGRALEPSARFASVRDAPPTLDDARAEQARAEYTPVLDTLSNTGTSRDEIVAMAVFHVQTANPAMQEARSIVRAGAAPVPTVVSVSTGSDLDTRLGAADSGGVAHDHIFAMVHGTLPSPSFVSATARTHGSWERDELGQLRVKRTDDVPFTLFLPPAGDRIPVVIYQHQRSHERSDAAALANRLAAEGIAVLALDAPFQGLRARPADGVSTVDTRNRFTGAPGPDQFGDEPGDFYGEHDAQGKLMPLHPVYARDALRQGVVDLMTAVRFLDEGSLDPITATSSLVKDYKLQAAHLGFIGEDVGAQMGVMLAPFEPSLEALVLFGAGGGLVEQWWNSPAQQTLFTELAQRLGRDASQIDYAVDSPAYWPGLAVVDALLTRGDPMAYTSSLRRAPVNVLMLTAKDDEVTSNLSSEALAVALGATFLDGQPRYVGDLTTATVASGASGLGANFTIGTDRFTRVLYEYTGGDHGLLIGDSGVQRYARPLDPPFSDLSAPRSLDNPMQPALAQIAHYFSSFFDCVASATSSASVKCAPDVSVAP